MTVDPGVVLGRRKCGLTNLGKNEWNLEPAGEHWLVTRFNLPLNYLQSLIIRSHIALVSVPVPDSSLNSVPRFAVIAGSNPLAIVLPILRSVF